MPLTFFHEDKGQLCSLWLNIQQYMLKSVYDQMTCTVNLTFDLEGQGNNLVHWFLCKGTCDAVNLTLV